MKEFFTRCRYNFFSLVRLLSRMHHNSIVELLTRISSNVVEFIVAISRATNDLRNNIINDQPSMIHFSLLVTTNFSRWPDSTDQKEGSNTRWVSDLIGERSERRTSRDN
jgi:hypothetical protein